MNQLSTEIQPAPDLIDKPRPPMSAMAVLASRLQCDPKKLFETLKATVFKGATDEEMMTLTVVANEYRLNPLTKELYAFPAKSGGIVPVVSVDGWTNLMNSHPMMDGFEHSFEHDEAGKLVSCTAIIYRKDRSHPVKVTEYLSECRRSTEPWKMEHRMLRHKALIQCARVAFGFSGIHDEDEARDIQVAKVREIPVARTEPLDPFKAATPPLSKRAEAPPLILDAAPETFIETLNRRIREDKLDAEKVAAFLADELMPPLDIMSEGEAETLLAHYLRLKEAAK